MLGAGLVLLSFRVEASEADLHHEAGLFSSPESPKKKKEANSCSTQKNTKKARIDQHELYHIRRSNAR
jgi:hypothetical protein